MDENATYALKDQEERQRRIGMLERPHIKPLIQYLCTVQTEMGSAYKMPYFDPCDGGVNAQVLFLLEAPGGQAVISGFISRNNPDPSARNMNELLGVAGLPRKATLLWNIVPWYIGDGRQVRQAKKRDIRQALPFLADLLHLLPQLRA